MPIVSPALVIEDDRDLLAMLKALLIESGFRALTARSGASALDLLESETPSAILLDLRLPGMDGAEFLRRARERRVEPPIVIVVCAGLHAHAEAEQLGGSLRRQTLRR